MPLVPCPDCGTQVSTEAAACPNCGRLNKAVAAKAKDGRQAGGCAVMVVGLLVAFLVQPLLGLIILAAGFIYAALNTRLK